MQKEVWKKIDWIEIDKFKYKYYVSNFGRVKSDNKILKFDRKINKAGYYSCSLGRRRTEAVHRLVAIAFLGFPLTNSHQVNHKDSNKLNNRVENLEWITPKENIAHAIRSGRFDDHIKSMSIRNSGEGNVKAKLTRANVIEIRRIYKMTGRTQKDIGIEFGVTQGTIGNILLGKTWANVTE